MYYSPLNMQEIISWNTIFENEGMYTMDSRPVDDRFTAN